MKKRGIRLAALLLLLLTFSLSFTSCAAVRSPLRYIKRATGRMLAGNTLGAVFEVLAESINDGAITVGFDGAAEENGVSGGEVTAYFTSDRDRLAAIGSFTVGGKEYDADIYFGSDGLAVRSTAFLGSNTVGISLDSIEKDLANSIFRNNSGSSYANTDVDDSTAGEIRGYIESFFALYAASEEMQKTAEDAIDVFLSALEENGHTVYYRKDGKMVITFTMDNGALSKSLRETRKELVSSRKFCKNLRKWATETDKMMSALGGAVKNDYAKKIEQFLTDDKSTEALCAKIDQAEAFTVTMEAEVRSLTVATEKLSLQYAVGGEVTYALAFDLSSKNEMSFSLVTPEAERELRLQNITSKRSEFSADILLSATAADVEQAASGTVSWQKKTGEFQVELERDGVKRTVEGSFRLSRSQFLFEIVSVKRDGEKLPFSICLEASVGEAMPRVPEYIELFTMDETRYGHIHEILAPAKEQLEADFERLSPSVEKTVKYCYDALGLTDLLPDPARIPKDLFEIEES